MPFGKSNQPVLIGYESWWSLKSSHCLRRHSFRPITLSPDYSWGMRCEKFMTIRIPSRKGYLIYTVKYSWLRTFCVGVHNGTLDENDARHCLSIQPEEIKRWRRRKSGSKRIVLNIMSRYLSSHLVLMYITTPLGLLSKYIDLWTINSKYYISYWRWVQHSQVSFIQRTQVAGPCAWYNLKFIISQNHSKYIDWYLYGWDLSIYI